MMDGSTIAPPLGHNEEVATPGEVVAITDFAGLMGHRPAFEAAHAGDPEAGFFLSWPWLEAVLRESAQDWVVLGWRRIGAAGFDAVLPLAKTLRWSSSRGQLVSELTSAGRQGMSDRGGFICALEVEAVALADFARYLSGVGWSHLSLRHDAVPERLQRFANSFEAPEYQVTWP
ncbi:hypothetical protein [Shimia abyssi]|uniref:Uncharacterized protein n=1 Tax=Shimia abyssi TaxID=1662395 RepID=A0A2P8F628_9RHOB|nr:hypothetical protein [Shimia abyssi]PSL17159.1 hypothetical protein CLV88_12011 [Shimia abyssi]